MDRAPILNSQRRGCFFVPCTHAHVPVKCYVMSGALSVVLLSTELISVVDREYYVCRLFVARVTL